MCAYIKANCNGKTKQVATKITGVLKLPGEDTLSEDAQPRLRSLNKLRTPNVLRESKKRTQSPHLRGVTGIWINLARVHPVGKVLRIPYQNVAGQCECTYIFLEWCERRAVNIVFVVET